MYMFYDKATVADEKMVFNHAVRLWFEHEGHLLLMSSFKKAIMFVHGNMPLGICVGINSIEYLDRFIHLFSCHF